MKQVVQSLRGGAPRVADVPAPLARQGRVLVANACSVVSAGTERMVIDLAKKSLLGKARERPDQVRRVLQKMRTEGVIATLKAVNARLDDPMTLGYASAGVVLAVGEGVQAFRPGDRVASNGPHAGVVSVPANLCARLPDGVPYEQGAFAVLGAIALQGVRLAETSLGETAYVIGLGLLGQIATALLRAAGCRVLGTDPDAGRCELAVRMGAEAAAPDLDAARVLSGTHGRGADAVLITAATASSGPVALAGEAVRQKGRVVAVGAVGLDLPRRPYYFKEAAFVVSMSYGPGRYDAAYEERGHDYPAAYVRWTEQRNLQAVLDLMGNGRLDLSPLISHRFDIADAEQAYAMIEKSTEPYLGIVLRYPDVDVAEPERAVRLAPAAMKDGAVGVGFIGSGSFARTVLLPAIGAATGVRPVVLCSAGGLSAALGGERFGYEIATSDVEATVSNPDVDAVFVATRHDLHAGLVLQALRAGKHVFVEKPLALSLAEIDEIEQALGGPAAGRILLVGFNRRFAPATDAVLAHFQNRSQPLTVSIRFNAGAIPEDHWTQSEEEGGGRIVGEACHAIDLATRLSGAPVVRVFAEAIGGPDAPAVRHDQAFLTCRHADGSVSSIAYLSGGDRALPKERVEVFGDGRAAVIDDWRRVTLAAGGKVKRSTPARGDKGHRAEIQAFLDAIRHGTPPIPWAQIKATSRAAILAVQSLREGVPFDV